MIRSIAAALSKHWTKIGVIGEPDKETYQYGLELLISTFINLVIMIGISIAFGHPLIVVPYLLAFIPFRLFAGGYHARNHLFCILFNALTYSVSCLIALHVKESTGILACVIESSVSLAVVFLFAPVSAKNKPLTQEEKKRNRMISLVIALGFILLCITLYYAHKLGSPWCNMLFCGQMMAVVLLTIGKTEEGFSKKQF